MLKIIFYIKSEKIKLNGESPIYCKIKLDNESVSLSTGKSISLERWNKTNRLRNLLKLEKEKILKKSLELLLLKIEKKYNDLVSITNDISIIILKDEIISKQKKVKKIQLLDVFEKHNFEFAKKVLSGKRSSASLQKYNRSAELIKNFIKKTYGLNNIEVEKINSSFIYNLETYLKFESEFKGIIGIKNNYTR